MSKSYSLVCLKTKEFVRVGQGYDEMDTFYYADKCVMESLGEFLKRNADSAIALMCNEDNEFIYDYEEFGNGGK